ncbi:MAG: hypothetical protein HY815_10850 [Candidatus Riflebacteria bacterium]|nr:hypothetical protein [Candidatus Riflebacteria bacterium]
MSIRLLSLALGLTLVGGANVHAAGAISITASPPAVQPAAATEPEIPELSPVAAGLKVGPVAKKAAPQEAARPAPAADKTRLTAGKPLPVKAGRPVKSARRGSRKKGAGAAPPPPSLDEDVPPEAYASGLVRPPGLAPVSPPVLGLGSEGKVVVLGAPPATIGVSAAVIGAAPVLGSPDGAIAGLLGFGGPQAARLQTDLKDLADAIEDEVAHERKLAFEELAAHFPAEVVVQALARIIAKGGIVARHQAARLLGQAPGQVPRLILLEEVRRKHARTTLQGIVCALRPVGARDIDHPIAEGKLLLLLEQIAENPERNVTEHLIPLLNSYPEFRIPIVRTLARIQAKEAITPIKSLVGGSDDLEAEALGALMHLGVDYEANRERLSRALPRAAEWGQRGLGAFQTILFYLHQATMVRKDPLAVKPIFYIVPHGAEPFRSQAMGILYKIALQAPQVFVKGVAALAGADQDEFMDDLVAFLYQKDLDQQFIDSWSSTFKNLDLSFQHHDLAQRMVRMVRDKVP